MSCFVRKIEVVNVAAKLRSRRIKVVLGPDYQGRDIPHFGDAFSNRTYFRACMADFGWVPFSELGGRKIKKTERRRIAVKPKSADDYAGRPIKT